ncbi:hypothetical protein ABZ234_12790 [Nocardiopsis sp. NPDC006198]|uniref:hypothetical protein n=1 Tax=Nocardiopsis sp. NPDC006198 TaxID=3154472 RepID=UPI0033B5A778
MNVARPLRVIPGSQETPVPPVAPTTTPIQVNSGDKLVVERARRSTYDFVGGRYYLMSKALTAAIPHMKLTPTETDVLHHILGNQESGGILKATHEEIGVDLGIGRSEVGKAVRTLSRIGLIWQQRRGELAVNPRCAYFGVSGLQNEAVAAIPDHVPQIVLPQSKVRPPRRRRKLR